AVQSRDRLMAATRRCLIVCVYAVVGPVPAVTEFLAFFYYCNGNHRDLHSFPTRRSSDLERERMVRVGGVKQDYVVGAGAGNGGEERVAQIAVRIEEGNAPPGLDVGGDELVEKCRLALAR